MKRTERTGSVQLRKNAYSRGSGVTATTKLMMATVIVVSVILGACIVAAAYAARQSTCHCGNPGEGLPAEAAFATFDRLSVAPTEPKNEEILIVANEVPAVSTEDPTTTSSGLVEADKEKQKEEPVAQKESDDSSEEPKGNKKKKNKSRKNKKNKNRRNKNRRGNHNKPSDDDEDNDSDSGPVIFHLDDLARTILEHEERAMMNCVLEKRRQPTFLPFEAQRSLKVFCRGGRDEPFGPVVAIASRGLSYNYKANFSGKLRKNVNGDILGLKWLLIRFGMMLNLEAWVHGGPELSGDSLSLSLVDHSSEGTTTTMNPIAEKLLDLTRSIMQASKTQAPVSQPKNSMYARTPHQLHPMVTGQIVPQRSQNLLRNAPSASAALTSNDVNPDKTMPKNVDMQHLKEIFREALRVLEAPETKTPIPSAANTPSNPELRLKLRLVPTPSPRVPHHLHHHQQHNPIPNHKGNNPLAQYTLRYSPSRGSARNPPPPTVRTMVVPIKKIPPPSPKPSQKMAFTVVIPSKIHIPTTSKPKILSPKETKASGKFLALVKPKPPPPKPTQPRAKPTTNAKTTPRKTPIVTTTTMTKKRAQETRKPSSISIVTSQKSSPKVREMKIITTRPTESTFEELLNKATQGDFLDLTDRKRHFLKPSIRHTLMPISPETSAKMQRNNKPHQANNKNNNNKKPPSSEFLVRAASNHHQSSSEPSSTITPSTETPTTISTTMHPVTGAHRRRLEYKSFPMQPIIGSHNPSLEFYFQTPVPPSVVYTVGSGSRYGVLDPRVQQNVAHPFFGSSATSSFLLPELTFEPSTITSTTESTTTSTTSSTSPTTTESAKQPEKTGEDSMNNIKFMYPSMTPIITRIHQHHPPEAVISNLMMEHPDNYAYHNNPPASVAEEILPSGHQEPVIHSDVPGMEEYSDYYDGTAMMTTSASPVNVIYHAKPSPGVRKRFRGNRKRDRNFLMRKYWGSSSANNKNSGDYPQHQPGFFETRQRRKISGRHQGRRRASPPLMRPMMSGGHRRHSGVELPKPEHLLEALQRPVAVLPLQFKRDATATGGGGALQRRGFHRKDLYNRATASAAAVMAAPARIRPLLRRPNYFKRSMLMSPLAKATNNTGDDVSFILHKWMIWRLRKGSGIRAKTHCFDDSSPNRVLKNIGLDNVESKETTTTASSQLAEHNSKESLKAFLTHQMGKYANKQNKSHNNLPEDEAHLESMDGLGQIVPDNETKENNVLKSIN
ncbi:unnamed protein product [Notodromas monacha]|uniref:Uncharacterized protein n=1 Tax=Notodromas monacha TaxID=399045 RepID=A0A7R9GIS6_9CRUS|nr:unnamed protein product [Notodromas monacha]CAG0922911.1 unnamed protein product [Notodromas monacha]